MLLSAQGTATYFEDWASSTSSPVNSTQNNLLERIATATDAANNQYVASSIFNTSTSVHDLHLSKYDEYGTPLWTVQHNVSGGGDVLIGGVAVDGDGNAHVAGSVLKGSNGFDALCAKFDPDGTVLWASTWNGSFNGHDGAASIAIDANGNAYLVGVATNSAISRNFLTIKYKTDGQVLWASQYDHNGLIDVGAKVELVSGEVVAWGAVQVSATTWKLGKAVYNASTGIQTSAGATTSPAGTGSSYASRNQPNIPAINSGTACSGL